MKQLSGTVAEIGQMIEGAPFNLFLGSNQEKCSNLWATIQRLDASLVNVTGDLIDKSFRQAPQSHMTLGCMILSYMILSQMILVNEQPWWLSYPPSTVCTWAGMV